MPSLQADDPRAAAIGAGDLIQWLRARGAKHAAELT